MDSAKPLAGGIPMVNIDGARIRRIREEKGLTQLYVATVVGVTTDTISRWENRRYPNIKKENAVKLAEALETELREILDHGRPAPPAEPPLSPGSESSGQEAPVGLPDKAAETAGPEASPAPAAAPPKSRPSSFPPAGRWLGAILLFALAGLALLWRFTAGEGDNQVAAVRTLPGHATPGIPFPVVIEVTTGTSSPFSLILRETLPPDCTPSQGKPPFVSQASDPPVLKWIGKITGGRAVYSYLARLAPEATMESLHRFTGGVTVRSDDDPSLPVAGGDSLQASPFHWADGDSDGRIDDEELLSVYETYGGIEGLHFGKKLIEEIWAAKGYRWNAETRGYEILH